MASKDVAASAARSASASVDLPQPEGPETTRSGAIHDDDDDDDDDDDYDDVLCERAVWTTFLFDTFLASPNARGPT